MKYKAKKVNGKKIDEHRIIFEKHLGRKLLSSEVIHHIDKNKQNNKISNLMLFPTKSAHTKFHLQEGDLNLFCGINKKGLIDGKLKCCHCKKLKELNKFVTSKRNHLGVIGVCKDCHSIQRKKYKKS